MDKNKYTIRIQDKEYTIVSGDTEEYVRQVAFVVDKKLAEVSAVNTHLSTAMAAILVALNLADEYTKNENTCDNLRKQVTSYDEDLAFLNREVKELKIKNGELELSLREMEIAMAKKETELNELRNRKNR